MKKSDYNFCSKIVQILLTYGEERYRNRKYHKPQRRDNRNFRTKKRYFLRRSDNRAPFLHKRNVRRYNPISLMKMQNIFNENQSFILVYVDDILVFSKSYKEHIAHLEVFFRKVEQNG